MGYTTRPCVTRTRRGCTTPFYEAAPRCMSTGTCTWSRLLRWWRPAKWWSMPTVAWSRLLHLVPADDVRVSVSRTKSLTRYFGKSHKERSPVCGQRYALVIYVECSRRKDKGFLKK